MTPVASWSPADYYAASRAARRACEARSEQLTFGLDDGDATRADGFGCGVPIVEPVSWPQSHPPEGRARVTHTREGRRKPLSEARRPSKGA